MSFDRLIDELTSVIQKSKIENTTMYISNKDAIINIDALEMFLILLKTNKIIEKKNTEKITEEKTEIVERIVKSVTQYDHNERTSVKPLRRSVRIASQSKINYKEGKIYEEMKKRQPNIYNLFIK